MLPSSELRLSYVGDNGVLERLAVMSPNSRTISVALEELVEDTSGRTFVLKLPEGKRTYFWQSEKSKVRGEERIAKVSCFCLWSAAKSSALYLVPHMVHFFSY